MHHRAQCPPCDPSSPELASLPHILLPPRSLYMPCCSQLYVVSTTRHGKSPFLLSLWGFSVLYLVSQMSPFLGTQSWPESQLSSPSEHMEWTSVLDSAHHSLQTSFSCLNFQFSGVCFAHLCFGACLSFCKLDFGLLEMRGWCNRSESRGHMERQWWLL